MELSSLGDAQPIFTTDDADRHPGHSIVQTDINQGDEVLSLVPIQKLPWELLSTIFLLCHRGDYRPSPASAPLLLCAICSGWRWVALETPQLWNTVKLRLSSSDEDLESDLNFSRMWIERSGSYPLSVDISMGLGVTIQQHPVVDLLILHFGRLQKIRASFLASLLIPLPRITPRSLDQLEDLELNFDVDNSFEQEHELEELSLFLAGDHLSGEDVGALGSTPRLRSVKLRCYPLLNVSRMALPWAQLTVLVIDGLTLPRESIPYYLTRCVNLEYCYLSIVAWSEGPGLYFQSDFPVPRPTRLQALHTLHLDFAYSRTTFRFYQPLILPSLKDFSLKHPAENASAILPVIQLQSRSGFELKRLCLTSIIDLPDVFVQILMPSIVELELNYPSWGLDWLIERLTYSTLEIPILPKLERLTVHGTHKDVGEDRIADLVESRWWMDNVKRPISRLHSLSLRYGRYDIHDINVAAQARIRKCQAEGLQYEINYNMDPPRRGDFLRNPS